MTPATNLSYGARTMTIEIINHSSQPILIENFSKSRYLDSSHIDQDVGLLSGVQAGMRSAGFNEVLAWLLLNRFNSCQKVHD